LEQLTAFYRHVGEHDYKFATAESNSFEQLKTSSEGGGEFLRQAYYRIRRPLAQANSFKSLESRASPLKKTVFIKNIL
jgi:hypothetical protein